MEFARRQPDAFVFAAGRWLENFRILRARANDPATPRFNRQDFAGLFLRFENLDDEARSTLALTPTLSPKERETFSSILRQTTYR